MYLVVLWAPSVHIEGGEYMSKDFDAFLAGHGIKHQFTMPYTPQKNDISKRETRSLMEMAQCMVKSQIATCILA